MKKDKSKVPAQCPEFKSSVTLPLVNRQSHSTFLRLCTSNGFQLFNVDSSAGSTECFS